MSALILSIMIDLTASWSPCSSSINSSISASSFVFLLFFLFSSFSFLPLLFFLPPSSLFLHIPVWRFPQFSLPFPGSGAPRSRTLSIPGRTCQVGSVRRASPLFDNWYNIPTFIHLFTHQISSWWFDTSVLLEKGKWNISAGKGRPDQILVVFM